jgi:hypothetical protein
MEIVMGCAYLGLMEYFGLIGVFLHMMLLHLFQFD